MTSIIIVINKNKLLILKLIVNSMNVKFQKIQNAHLYLYYNTDQLSHILLIIIATVQCDYCGKRSANQDHSPHGGKKDSVC